MLSTLVQNLFSIMIILILTFQSAPNHIQYFKRSTLNVKGCIIKGHCIDSEYGVWNRCTPSSICTFAVLEQGNTCVVNFMHELVTLSAIPEVYIQCPFNINAFWRSSKWLTAWVCLNVLNNNCSTCLLVKQEHLTKCPLRNEVIIRSFK